MADPGSRPSEPACEPLQFCTTTSRQDTPRRPAPRCVPGHHAGRHHASSRTPRRQYAPSMQCAAVSALQPDRCRSLPPVAQYRRAAATRVTRCRSGAARPSAQYQTRTSPLGSARLSAPAGVRRSPGSAGSRAGPPPVPVPASVPAGAAVPGRCHLSGRHPGRRAAAPYRAPPRAGRMQSAPHCAHANSRRGVCARCVRRRGELRGDPAQCARCVSE